MCGLLMHDCRRPDAPPPGWHTTAIGLSGKGEGEVDGLTPSDSRFAFIINLTI